MYDLEAAFLKAEPAVSATSGLHHDRAKRLSDLGYRLSDGYSQKGNMDDLEAAFSIAEPTVFDLPQHHFPDLYSPTREMDDLEAEFSIAEPAAPATYRLQHNPFSPTRKMDDLEAEFSIAEPAVSATYGLHPDRAKRLSDKGIRLSDRYCRTGNMDDLEAAISRAEPVVSITPEDRPDRADSSITYSPLSGGLRPGMPPRGQERRETRG